MGNYQSNNIKCFNQMNSRYYKKETNFGLTLHDCQSNLDATFKREFPKGCYMYVCENCYYGHYKDKDNITIEEFAKIPSKPDDLEMEYDDDNYTYSSKLPKPEWEMDLKEIKKKENDSDDEKSNASSASDTFEKSSASDKPTWSEYQIGVAIIE